MCVGVPRIDQPNGLWLRRTVTIVWPSATAAAPTAASAADVIATFESNVCSWVGTEFPFSGLSASSYPHGSALNTSAAPNGRRQIQWGRRLFDECRLILFLGPAPFDCLLAHGRFCRHFFTAQVTIEPFALYPPLQIRNQINNKWFQLWEK